jgi:pyruvate,water dikinase
MVGRSGIPGADLVGETYPGAMLLGADHGVPPLADADLSRGWGLDFHYPRGIHPLSHELVCILAASSRAAAAGLPVAPSRGLDCRVVGPHVFTGFQAVPDPSERAERAVAAATALCAYPELFATGWPTWRAELDAEYAALCAIDLASATRSALRAAFDSAIAHYTHAWRVHFEVMYRLLAVSEEFQTVCSALGLPAGTAADLIPSGDTTIRRTDHALRALARSARASGLAPLLNRSDGLADAVREAPHAAEWWGRFEQFLARFGQRSDTIVDVASLAWSDEPERPLSLIRDLLRHDADASTGAYIAARDVERQARRAAISDGLSRVERNVFDRALLRAEQANFARWNEEHNATIDLRSHLPVGRIAGELATRGGLSGTDGWFLFAAEIRTVDDLRQLADAVATRRTYLRQWRGRRGQLPCVVGSPAEVGDPVIRQIVGLAPGTPPEAGVLRGVGTSPGAARGPARVVRSPDELHRVGTGDILICEATSPSWTPVFPRLSGCVCDAGGAMTHAAIICREYGIPAVSAVGLATRYFRDDDVLHVDGGSGAVSMLRRA